MVFFFCVDEIKRTNAPFRKRCVIRLELRFWGDVLLSLLSSKVVFVLYIFYGNFGSRNQAAMATSRTFLQSFLLLFSLVLLL